MSTDFNKSNDYVNQKFSLNSLPKGVFPINITLKKPLSLEEAQIFINQYNIQVNSYIVGANNEHGDKYIFSSWPDNNTIISSKDIQTYIAPDHTLKGVLVISGAIDTSQPELAAMIDHPSVYLVDLTAIDLIHTVQQTYHVNVVSTDLPSPYWDLDW